MTMTSPSVFRIVRENHEMKFENALFTKLENTSRFHLPESRLWYVHPNFTPLFLVTFVVIKQLWNYVKKIRFKLTDLSKLNELKLEFVGRLSTEPTVFRNPFRVLMQQQWRSGGITYRFHTWSSELFSEDQGSSCPQVRMLNAIKIEIGMLIVGYHMIHETVHPLISTLTSCTAVSFLFRIISSSCLPFQNRDANHQVIKILNSTHKIFDAVH